jgi:hypothetical protein
MLCMSFQAKSVVWPDIYASNRGRISARIRARRDPPKKLVALKGEAGGKPFTPVSKQKRNRIKVTWTQPLVLKAGDKLALAAEF